MADALDTLGANRGSTMDASGTGNGDNDTGNSGSGSRNGSNSAGNSGSASRKGSNASRKGSNASHKGSSASRKGSNVSRKGSNASRKGSSVSGKGRGGAGKGSRCGGGCGKRPAADIVIVQHLSAEGTAAFAEIAGGGTIPTSVLEEHFCDAEVTGAVFSDKGKPLWQGPTKQTATEAH